MGEGDAREGVDMGWCRVGEENKVELGREVGWRTRVMSTSVEKDC